MKKINMIGGRNFLFELPIKKRGYYFMSKVTFEGYVKEFESMGKNFIGDLTDANLVYQDLGNFIKLTYLTFKFK